MLNVEYRTSNQILIAENRITSKMAVELKFPFEYASQVFALQYVVYCSACIESSKYVDFYNHNRIGCQVTRIDWHSFTDYISKLSLWKIS